MKEEILLNLLVLLLCFGVAMLTFKVILDLLPKKMTHGGIIKATIGVVYWFWFVVLLNVPFYTYDIYNLVPYDDGSYYRLTEDSEFGYKDVRFQYREGVNTVRESISISEQDLVQHYIYEEDVVEIDTYNKNEDSLQRIIKVDEDYLIAVKSKTWTLLDLYPSGENESWCIHVLADEFEEIIEFLPEMNTELYE